MSDVYSHVDLFLESCIRITGVWVLGCYALVERVSTLRFLTILAYVLYGVSCLLWVFVLEFGYEGLGDVLSEFWFTVSYGVYAVVSAFSRFLGVGEESILDHGVEVVDDAGSTDRHHSVYMIVYLFAVGSIGSDIYEIFECGYLPRVVEHLVSLLGCIHLNWHIEKHTHRDKN